MERGGKKTDSFGVDVEMVLIVVNVPEGCVASVRDVACMQHGRSMTRYSMDTNIGSHLSLGSLPEEVHRCCPREAVG
jgi:hypothetical protein